MNQSTATNSPAGIAWKDRYSVGNDHLDGQHQEILALVNLLYEALERGEGQDSLPTIARRLADYANTHFRDEEQVMAGTDYPGIEDHRRIHQEYADKTSDFLFACIQGAAPEARDVLGFLKLWWINHISGTDKEYAPFLQGEQSQEASGPGIDQELDDLLEALIKNEEALSRYYAAMVDLVPGHADVWISLSQQEGGHARALRQVRRAAEQSPHLFAAGEYSPTTVRFVTDEINEMLAKIERHEAHAQYAITFVADIERSLFESNLDKAVETDVAEVQSILQRLAEETAAHHDLLRTVST